jgi:hypothetical protein
MPGTNTRGSRPPSKLQELTRGQTLHESLLVDQIGAVYDGLQQARNDWKLVAGQLVPPPQEWRRESPSIEVHQVRQSHCHFKSASLLRIEEETQAKLVATEAEAQRCTNFRHS